MRAVEESFAGTFSDAGFKVSPDLVRHAAEVTGGYPFLIQLVGYFLWREAENNHGNLTSETVERAIEAANRRNARTVIAAAVATVSTAHGKVDFAIPGLRQHLRAQPRP